MRNIFRIIVVVCFVAFLLFNCSGEDSQDTVTLRVPVTIEEVKKGDIASFISLTGTLLSAEEMPVLAELGGNIHFEGVGLKAPKNGDIVKKDQVLAKVTNEDHILNVRLEYKKLAMEQAARDLIEKKRLGEMGGIPPREVEAAERNKMDTELNYQKAILDLEKLNVKAPMDGVLADMQAFTEGQKINNNTELGKVMNFTRVRCELNVTNDDIAKVKTGQDVFVTNFAYEDEPFLGRVVKISPTIDPTTRTFKVDVEVNNPDLRLRPGMFVRADIIVSKRANVVRVPKHLIFTRNNREVVFIAEEQVAKMKEVSVGLTDAEYAEILNGVEEGDKLVIRGYETLKDNTKVRVSR